MKTPRELLLERHRHTRPKLDTIRRDALASANQIEPERAVTSLRNIFMSLRWHLVGMSAIWVIVLFLHLGTSRPSQMMASVPTPKVPASQVIMASFRENRRQLAEMIDSRPPANEHRELLAPKPRSDRHTNLLTA